MTHKETKPGCQHQTHYVDSMDEVPYGSQVVEEVTATNPPKRLYKAPDGDCYWVTGPLRDSYPTESTNPVDQNDLNAFQARGQSPNEILLELSRRFQDKDAIWGSSWKNAGEIMHVLFPEKFTRDEWQKIVCIVMITLKLQRSTKKFPEISEDSVGDLATYAAMLASLQSPNNPA